MFRSRLLSQHLPLPVLAVSAPSLFDLCGRHLLPPGQGLSAFDSLDPFCGRVQRKRPDFHSPRLSRRLIQSNSVAPTRAEILSSTANNPVSEARMLSLGALREQKESKQRVLFSISYKCRFYQLLLIHNLTNSGGRGFFYWHRINSGYSLLTTHYSPLTVDYSLPPPPTSTDRCGAKPHA